MSRFASYLLAVGLAALATGIQVVMVPWLAVGELHLSAQQVGWVQAAGLLPVVVLMLSGGALADRPRAWRWLPLLYLGVCLCHASLLWLWLGKHLGLVSLVTYALLLGVLQAFTQPLRDRVLPRFMASQSNEQVTSLHVTSLQSKSLQGSVVRVGLSVYVAQAVGVLLAGQSELLGIGYIVAAQALVVLLCAVLLAWVLWRDRSLELSSENQSSASQPSLSQSTSLVKSDLAEGFGFVMKHPVLRPLLLLVSFNGFMNMGVFVVAVPLLSHLVYQQNAWSFSMLQMLFVVGGIVASIVLIRRGHVEQPGRAVLFCVLYTGLVMVSLGAQPKESGLLLLIFIWGVVAAVSASLGKGLVQQLATEALRGRVLSMYQLALFGSAPLGALACGYLAEVWGPLLLLKVGGWSCVGVFALYLGVRSLWNVPQLDELDQLNE